MPHKIISFCNPRFFASVAVGIACIIILSIKGSWVSGLSYGLPIILLGMFKFDFSNKINNTLNFIWLTLAIIFFSQVSQYIVGWFIFPIMEEHWQRALTEVLVIAVLPLVLFAITLKPKLSFFVGVLPLLLISIADYFIYVFRGSEFNPMDFLAIGTATQVAGNYNFSFGLKQYCGLALFLLIMQIGLSLGPMKFSKRFIPRLVLILLAVPCAYFAIHNLKHTYIMTWDNMGTKFNGFLVNFGAQVMDMLNQEPDGYSVNFVDSVATEYTDLTLSAATPDTLPNIIVIMDEAFADLSVLNPEFKDSLFYKTLTENTIKGYALVSVLGGGTANSEYEFLTGNSMAFLNHGVSVFQQYLSTPSFSIASYLKKMGYECHATHPFNKQGWSRTRAWPALGFEKMSFLEDYPRKKKIRGYVSDQEMFEYVVDILENKTSKPLFLFGVTMQNHSGYMRKGENIPRVPIKDYPNHPDAEQYLGLLYESDKALKYLITRLQNSEEKTVVVFYGDHFPGLDQEFLKTLYKSDFEKLQDKQKLHTVPFFVWANYDIEEQQVGLTSLNFLSNFVYEAAGIEAPHYNKFLADVQKVVPAMNSWGYFSRSNNKFLEYKDAIGTEAEALNRYRMLQYNSLFDNNGRNPFFFGI